jgi:hypothetical protein
MAGLLMRTTGPIFGLAFSEMIQAKAEAETHVKIEDAIPVHSGQDGVLVLWNSPT